MLCTDVFGRERDSPHPTEFWPQIHKRLQYLVGSPTLVKDVRTHSFMGEVVAFLRSCPDGKFLDFIECIFQADDYRKFWSQRDYLVSDINDLLLVDDIPYAVTRSVWKLEKAPLYGGQLQEREELVAHPKVICRDDEATHTLAIEPALTLLRDHHFTSANQEFLDALSDYRKGDYGDCLVKCGSAFESTMKLICDRKGWPYSQSDTARPLLQVIFQNSQLEQNLFEQALMNIATLRNKLSNAHGAGTQQRNIPQHLAKYAINATAAAMLLLVEECT
jgi:Abortive infection C-terminus